MPHRRWRSSVKSDFSSTWEHIFRSPLRKRSRQHLSPTVPVSPSTQDVPRSAPQMEQIVSLRQVCGVLTSRRERFECVPDAPALFQCQISPHKREPRLSHFSLCSLSLNEFDAYVETTRHAGSQKHDTAPAAASKRSKYAPIGNHELTTSMDGTGDRVNHTCRVSGFYCRGVVAKNFVRRMYTVRRLPFHDPRWSLHGLAPHVRPAWAD